MLLINENNLKEINTIALNNVTQISLGNNFGMIINNGFAYSFGINNVNYKIICSMVSWD
jgi:hypothetical protein